MKGFERRKQKGQELQDSLIEKLHELQIDYFLSGYENMHGSKNARFIIQKNSDSVSRFIRYYPDISVIKPDKSVLIEVKNSTGIEKDCYETYMSLHAQGLILLLYMKNQKLCLVQDLRFQKAQQIDFVSKIKIPVVDQVWRCPRLLPEDQYHRYLAAYRAQNKYTSGCSFAFIDFNKTRFYDLERIADSTRRKNG